ncbi:MAG TPA: pectin esterase, partial [Prevotella sp.]|nr:pectin esterase [Prevotella sp.]
VSGKTVSFQYKALEYDKEYTFSLPANSISDLTNNKMAESVSITFKTKTRPVIAKAMYDFIVPTDGSLQEAFAAAAKRSDNTKRYRIFIKNGNYVLPASTTATKHSDNGKDYPDPTTYLNSPNISIIGESRDGVVITNTVPNEEWDNGYGMANVLEGIGRGDVLSLQKNATGTYFQDLTMKSAMGDAKGRDIVLNDQSNKTVCKNVCLWAYQDTYVSNNNKSRFYFEGGVLRGNTDFLCGKGDVYYNKVDLQVCNTGYIAVPSLPTKYGYIFKDCTIKAEKKGIDGNFTLGRPWGKGTPIALFIDTKMEAQPSAIGWNEMSGGWPARFAEYNSQTAKGSQIDLSGRKKTFGDGHANNPVLSKDEADFYTISNVMGDGDDWDPTALTEQASAPQNVLLSEGKLTWDDSHYVLLWAVCKDGKVVCLSTENHYDNADSTSKWSVRAANEMGGLGEAAEAKNTSAVKEINSGKAVAAVAYYNMDGTRVSESCRGQVIKV